MATLTSSSRCNRRWSKYVVMMKVRFIVNMLMITIMTIAFSSEYLGNTRLAFTTVVHGLQVVHHEVEVAATKSLGFI